MIELLAPAGNLQKLKTAVHFGADAVYFGGPYSLRAAADGFSGEALFAAMKELHARGKRAISPSTCSRGRRTSPAWSG